MKKREKIKEVPRRSSSFLFLDAFDDLDNKREIIIYPTDDRIRKQNRILDFVTTTKMPA